MFFNVEEEVVIIRNGWIPKKKKNILLKWTTREFGNCKNHGCWFLQVLFYSNLGIDTTAKIYMYLKEEVFISANWFCGFVIEHFYG